MGDRRFSKLSFLPALLAGGAWLCTLGAWGIFLAFESWPEWIPDAAFDPGVALTTVLCLLAVGGSLAAMATGGAAFVRVQLGARTVRGRALALGGAFLALGPLVLILGPVGFAIWVFYSIYGHGTPHFF